MKAVATLPLYSAPPEDLEATRGVEFIEMPVRQILNRCDSPRVPFRWTINPYRGCEFGCGYCYARYTHDFLELRDPMDFERRIFVKRMAAEVLARTLSRTPIGTDAIAIGTATDPYQPAERKYGLTRSMLEVFAQLSGLELSITTKSSLIVRDLEWLKKINRRSKLSVNFSLITLDRKLQRILEPRAPRPGLRLRALLELARAGIRCNVLMMPMIPGLTDDPAAIESVIRGAHRAGASAVWWRSLFLKPAAARRFIPLVRERFPHLAERIDMFYARAEYVPRAYDDRMGVIFDRIRARYGFPIEHERCTVRPAAAPQPRQLSLGGLVEFR
ncbi:SPL family radical SAM protein [Candidatus Binatus sp.]|uniref:SPL family radical SAM protein n=1 Tax=Candidatus Binatus sp. TaxID=2811406 RepID=UPI002F93586F